MNITAITCCGKPYLLGLEGYPRFSWNTVGFVPISYRICIREEGGDALVYDTGVCPSADTHEVEVPFLGRPRTAYRVAVTSFDAAGGEATGECTFETGLDPADTADGWVAAPGVTAPCFCRDIPVAGRCTRGRLYVCALGYGDVELNGRPLREEYFVPAWSDFHPRDMSDLLYPITDRFSHSAYYLTYDVTERLEPGENRLSVTVGNGFYHQNRRQVEGCMDYGEPKLFWMLEWTDETGEHRLKADERTRVYQSGWLENNIYYGETFDAGFQPGEGRPATVVSAPETVMRSQQCPVDTAYSPVTPRLVKQEGERRIWDMGINMSGVVEFVTSAPTSTPVVLRYAEELDDRQELDFASTGTEAQIQSDTYLSNGQPGQRWHPRFCWHGFRYVEITGPVEEVRGIPIHADVSPRGDFFCDNEILNWVVEAYRQTQLCNLHGGVPSDCPHRERLGYTGDGQLTADTAMLFWDMDGFYRKWYRDILDGQCRETGHVQHTAPFYGGGGGPGVWGGAVAFLPYTLYRHTGDKSLLREALPAIGRYIVFCRGRCEDGVLVRELEGGWCLGDWCFSADTPGPSEAFVNTYCLIRMLEDGAFLAEESGDYALASQWKTWAGEHREAFRRTFYHPEDGTYDRGVAGAGAFALALGYTDALPALVAYYEERGRLDTGIAATPLVLSQFSRHGHTELAFRLLTAEGCPSFAHMRAQGATTLWEQWDGKYSHNHPMFGCAAGWCVHTLLGLDAENAAPGWKSLRIRPQFPEKLFRAAGYVTTPFGRVTVAWEKTDGGVTLSAELPARMDAVLEYAGEVYPLHEGNNRLALSL